MSISGRASVGCSAPWVTYRTPMFPHPLCCFCRDGWKPGPRGPRHAGAPGPMRGRLRPARPHHPMLSARGLAWGPQDFFWSSLGGPGWPRLHSAGPTNCEAGPDFRGGERDRTYQREESQSHQGFPPGLSPRGEGENELGARWGKAGRCVAGGAVMMIVPLVVFLVWKHK